MRILRTVPGLRGQVRVWRREDLRVGLVPTMGALHAGHLALVRRSVGACDRTITTLFVNPLQFGPGEDFERYPRQERADATKLKQAGCHVLFAPPVEELFPKPLTRPEDLKTTVLVRDLSERLCGRFRPGHFQGVATIVTKLLLITLADETYFGEKDYQQLQIVRRLARDLNIPVKIVGVPTVREPGGLAMSSRNAYLTPAERSVAPALYRTLTWLADRLRDGHEACRRRCDEAVARLLADGFQRVDYVEVVDADTLEPLDRVDRPARALAAAWLGRARLIDNVKIVGSRQ